MLIDPWLGLVGSKLGVGWFSGASSTLIYCVTKMGEEEASLRPAYHKYIIVLKFRESRWKPVHSRGGS